MAIPVRRSASATFGSGICLDSPGFECVNVASFSGDCLIFLIHEGSREHVRLGYKRRSVYGIEVSVPVGLQIVTLFLLAIPVASVAWTITHEAVLREFQEFCKVRSTGSGSILKRKFFYLFTCEYCLTHYVTAVFLVITRYKLLFPDWRGYLISLFSIVWVANQYIGIYDRLRLNIKHEHISISAQEQRVK
jgi:hypothetical protein